MRSREEVPLPEIKEYRRGACRRGRMTRRKKRAVFFTFRGTYFLTMSVPRWAILAGVTVLYLLVIWRALAGGTDPWSVTIRLAALTGLLTLQLAAMMSPFLKEIRKVLGAPFLAVHHRAALAGLILITLHPVSLAVRLERADIFLPVTQSLDAFFLNGGRVALILIYVGALAAVFQGSLGKAWRPAHGFLYLAIIIGTVHANLMGSDLSDPILFVIVNGMTLLVVAAFLAKRWQRHAAAAPTRQ
jgi:DMSO/TMAO reductase YedYZ heme-binding membrane subunit